MSFHAKIIVMKHKFSLNIFFLALLLLSGLTYASTNSSLWGPTAEPAVPVKRKIPQKTPPPSQAPQQTQPQTTQGAQKEDQELQLEQQKIANEKTVCELLNDQSFLNSDKNNETKIKDAIQYAYKIVLPDYKILLVNDASANDLYAKYRELYIKTYCMTPVTAIVPASEAPASVPAPPTSIPTENK